jgi:hypothetical protein
MYNPLQIIVGYYNQHIIIKESAVLCQRSALLALIYQGVSGFGTRQNMKVNKALNHVICIANNHT